MRRAINNLTRLRFSIVIVGWISLSIAMALSPAVPLLAESLFPYTAVVASSDAAVHSGPSPDFYETDKLTEGSKVEVYRHDEQDWYAIRPPENSFSWVAAEHLELTENPALARVINVPVKTRIGSRFNDEHDVEYISLRKGEVVEILGNKMLNEPGEPAQRWFKVAPPSGEFRWIHARHLAPANSKTTSEMTVGSGTIETFDLPDRSAGVSASNDSRVSLETKNQSAFTDVSNPVQTASYESVVAETASRSSVEATVPKTDSAEPVNATHVNTVTWEAVAPPNDVLSAPEPRSFQDRYNALNVMLSQAVLEEIEDWKLERVQQQAKLLLGYASDIEEQELANVLLAKINEFQNLKARDAQLAYAPEPVVPHAMTPASHTQEPSNLPSVKVDDDVPTSPEMPKLVRRAKQKQTVTGSALQRREAIDNSVFDASGVLIAVQSRRNDMPKYALTDNGGRITRFVSAVNGSALRKYVNQRVGLLGEVGYLRKFNKPHVVVSKIVTLER